MGLIQKLHEAAVEQSRGKSTIQCYSFWTRKFYGYTKLPGSLWTGDLVRQWMLHLADQNYSAVSRKQALNAIVFVFKFVLKKELGHLDLPPMPKVRHTLRIIPSRDELGRIFAGLPRIEPRPDPADRVGFLPGEQTEFLDAAGVSHGQRGEQYAHLHGGGSARPEVESVSRV